MRAPREDCRVPVAGSVSVRDALEFLVARLEIDTGELRFSQRLGLKMAKEALAAAPSPTEAPAPEDVTIDLATDAELLQAATDAYNGAARISGSAFLAGEKCPKTDRVELYRIACKVLVDVGYVMRHLEDRRPAPTQAPAVVPEPAGGVQGFLDQIDAENAASDWLNSYLPTDRHRVFWTMERFNFDPHDGRVLLVRAHERPVAAAIIVRDGLNRSQLLRWTAAPSPQQSAPAEPAMPKRYALNPDNGLMYESDRGSWVRFVDAAAALSQRAREPSPSADPAEGRSILIEEACRLIKAADDKASEGDYMLDSDDCISVLRGTWNAVGVALSPAAEAGGVAEHEASESCWCEPELFHEDPETGAKVFVHRRPQ